jgi:hypothetical protein
MRKEEQGRPSKSLPQKCYARAIKRGSFLAKTALGPTELVPSLFLAASFVFLLQAFHLVSGGSAPTQSLDARVGDVSSDLPQ